MADTGDPANPPDVPAPPKLPEVESPPTDDVLGDVPSKEDLVESASTVDEVVGEQPSVEDLLGGDR